MAITKLMNIKASKLGSPSTGLKNCIHYILKPEKTSGGLWVGGNAGSTPEEILDTFLQTKRRFEKMDKRQGYHFVISFDKKDQVSAERMKNIWENIMTIAWRYIQISRICTHTSVLIRCQGRTG
mgnify:CR=1 FL=1